MQIYANLCTEFAKNDYSSFGIIHALQQFLPGQDIISHSKDTAPKNLGARYRAYSRRGVKVSISRWQITKKLYKTNFNNAVYFFSKRLLGNFA